MMTRLLLPLALLLSGCSMFRAQVGLGFGLGADVQVFGLAHAGLLLGRYDEFGPNYGRGPSEGDYTVLGPFHACTTRWSDGEDEHDCFGLLPALLGGAPAPGPIALELGLALAPVSFRVGFNPAGPLERRREEEESQRRFNEAMAAAWEGFAEMEEDDDEGEDAPYVAPAPKGAR
ncbi:MAG: hypothetical protein KF878_26025 [Planctomycetes bacterium]|nr:hypothetical protein [Planctomycetota bacterium]